MSDKIPRCQVAVYKRDAYRYTGRGTGFELHHSREQCSRRASNEDGTMCWQHAAMKARGWNLGLANYHEFMENGE